MKVFFDSETSGKTDFKSPAEASHQPRLVQLGIFLVEDDGKEISSANIVVKPEGFVIPKEASNIHGITQEMALRVGVPLKIALGVFWGYISVADTMVAHNIDYDDFVMRGEFLRDKRSYEFAKDKKRFCTMRAMENVCKLPGNYGKYKWPTLAEAYKFAFGKEMSGSHNALYDILACKDIYFWLKQQTS